MTERPAIGATIARQVQTLLFYKEGKEYVGSWSGERVAVQVETWGKEYTVNLLVGNDVLRVATSHSWITKKQQWRFAEAIEEAVASARDKAEREEAFAEKARRQAEQLEKQARQPFLRAEELKARLARKADLDEYTALVAAAKKDAERQEELTARREQLLTNVPDFSFLADAIQPTPASRTNGSVVPLFGEPWAGQSRALRRRSSRQRTAGSEMHGEQLTLFPGLVEREA